MWVLSIANGDPYWPCIRLKIVPDPRHSTYSASFLHSAKVGEMAWVALCMGGMPSQYDGQPVMSWWCEERRN